MPEENIDTILTRYADSIFMLSDTYTSIMPNRDDSPRFKDNPNIDHAEQEAPPLSDMIVAFAQIRKNIEIMKTKLVEYAQ